MDLDTFFTQLYVLIDDWYKEHAEHHWHGERGPSSRLSDSEVVTLALAGQWRVGVPWQSERTLPPPHYRYQLWLFREVFGWRRPGAQSRGCQSTRLAAIFAAYRLNRCLGRPLHAWATLLD